MTPTSPHRGTFPAATGTRDLVITVAMVATSAHVDASRQSGRPLVLLRARGARFQDTVDLLGVGAAVVDVGVGEAGAPQHDAAEPSVTLILADDGRELLGRRVVRLPRRRAVRRQRGGRHADEDLGVGRRRPGRPFHPLVVVEGRVAVDGERARVRVVVVVVELRPEVVERGISDDVAHCHAKFRVSTSLRLGRYCRNSSDT